MRYKEGGSTVVKLWNWWQMDTQMEDAKIIFPLWKTWAPVLTNTPLSMKTLLWALYLTDKTGDLFLPLPLLHLISFHIQASPFSRWECSYQDAVMFQCLPNLSVLCCQTLTILLEVCWKHMGHLSKNSQCRAKSRSNHFHSRREKKAEKGSGIGKSILPVYCS